MLTVPDGAVVLDEQHVNFLYWVRQVLDEKKSEAMFFESCGFKFHFNFKDWLLQKIKIFDLRFATNLTTERALEGLQIPLWLGSIQRKDYSKLYFCVINGQAVIKPFKFYEHELKHI